MKITSIKLNKNGKYVVTIDNEKYNLYQDTILKYLLFSKKKIDNTLFENIVNNQKGIQTIVIENEIPEINYKDANIIHFTKEKNNGRYGFLLDVAD